MHGERVLDLARNLTSSEKELMMFLLSRDFPGRQALLEQLQWLKVSRECACGCPSIVFNVDKAHAKPANVNRRIPIEASCISGNDGSEAHFLLHVVDGWLDEMEAYRDDGQTVTELPTVSNLRLLCLDWNNK
jgi:hypothetical protein